MLVVLMHNRRDYLDSLRQLAIKEGITDATIIEKENIGSRIIGEEASFVFQRGENEEISGNDRK